MGKANKNVDSMEICDYMKYLNGNIWEYLFEDALAHETIFTSLSELEQIIISRLLFVQQVVSERAMRLWINPNCLKNLSEGIKNLVETKILVGSEMKKDNYFQYKINDKFRFNLLNKIYKNRENNIFIFNNNIKEQLEKEKELYENKLFPTKEDIFQHTQTKWNNLLHFIASPQKQNLNAYAEQWDDEEKKRHLNEASARCTHTAKREMNRTNKKWGDGENEYAEEAEEEQFDEDKYLCNDEEVEAEMMEEEEEEEEEDEDEKTDEHNQKEEYEEKNGNEFIDVNNKERENAYDNNDEYKVYSNHCKMKKGKRKKKEIRRNYSNSNNVVKYSNSEAEQKNSYHHQNVTSNQNNQINFLAGTEETNLNNNITSYAYETEQENTAVHNKKIMYIPNGSVIEILKRKNFISNESNKNKVISLSREAFSWFLKDLRSRIISLVLEYLLAIDGGNVTSVAKDLLMKYENKRESEKSKKKESHNQNNKSSVIETEIANSKIPLYSSHYMNGNSEVKQEGMEYAKKQNDNEIPYAAQKNKDVKRSESYVKETLLFILSVSQCSICQPIFLKNLTKAQKEFIDFGIHIGLFYKTNEQFIFITPYALLLNTNNANTRHYISLLNSLSIEGLCDSKFKKNLIDKYFHKYLLLQETGKGLNRDPEKQKTKEESEENKGEGLMTKYNAISQYEGCLKIETTPGTVVSGTSGIQLKPDITNFIDNNNDNNKLEIGLIVQSNFKVYLYTSSLLKINILSHLCELQARLPNMVVGILTRKSVLNAFTSGITANQIIKFLESYSHPFNKHCRNTIPNNVIAQLKLWESERHRLSFEDAIVFKSWERELLPYLYQQVVIWTNNKNYLLYYTPWPKNNTKEFEHWLKAEKYLCCIYESKNEVIEKIKEIREVLLKKKKPD